MTFNHESYDLPIVNGEHRSIDVNYHPGECCGRKVIKLDNTELPTPGVLEVFKMVLDEFWDTLYREGDYKDEFDLDIRMKDMCLEITLPEQTAQDSSQGTTWHAFLIDNGFIMVAAYQHPLTKKRMFTYMNSPTVFSDNGTSGDAYY